jgi:hypothetical protein
MSAVETAVDVRQEWLPLTLHSSLANTVEDISANIESALKRDYIPFNEFYGKKSGAVAIVGSGPSLKENWKQLRKFKGDILACNAACQFLLGKGIVPTYMMCFDADPLMLEFVTPHPEITYLMASRCPPKAFDMLDGCKVVCWHALGDERIDELLGKYKRMEPMVSGGGAAVTRSMVLVVAMGYTDVHLYGADSSFRNGDTHIRQSTTKERRMNLKVGERVFVVAPWMAQQAEEFKILLPSLTQRNGADFTVHGDGLIPHLAVEMGAKTDLEPRAKHFVRHWNGKARILWQNL